MLRALQEEWAKGAFPVCAQENILIRVADYASWPLLLA
jgi:hypothetical protein